MRLPYDLRHSGVTWRLNSGVPATEVAAWAGHSVEVLMRVYAQCVAGLEDVWIARIAVAAAEFITGPLLTAGNMVTVRI
jgi:integrase